MTFSSPHCIVESRVGWCQVGRRIFFDFSFVIFFKSPQWEKKRNPGTQLQLLPLIFFHFFLFPTLQLLQLLLKSTLSSFRAVLCGHHRFIFFYSCCILLFAKAKVCPFHSHPSHLFNFCPLPPSLSHLIPLDLCCVKEE